MDRFLPIERECQTNPLTTRNPPLIQDTPVPPFFAASRAAERAALVTDARLPTLPVAFASVPAPR